MNARTKGGKPKPAGDTVALELDLVSRIAAQLLAAHPTLLGYSDEQLQEPLAKSARVAVMLVERCAMAIGDHQKARVFSQEFEDRVDHLAAELAKNGEGVLKGTKLLTFLTGRRQRRDSVAAYLEFLKPRGRAVTEVAEQIKHWEATGDTESARLFKQLQAKRHKEYTDKKLAEIEAGMSPRAALELYDYMRLRGFGQSVARKRKSKKRA